MKTFKYSWNKDFTITQTEPNRFVFSGELDEASYEEDADFSKFLIENSEKVDTDIIINVMQLTFSNSKGLAKLFRTVFKIRNKIIFIIDSESTWQRSGFGTIHRLKKEGLIEIRDQDGNIIEKVE